MTRIQVLLAFLLLAPRGFANEIIDCSQIFFVPKQAVVTQCKGTCYFEAAVANFESLVSIYAKRDVGVVRSELFIKLMRLRIQEFFC